MTTQSLFRSALFLLSAATLFAASAVGAQEVEVVDDARDEVQLRADMRDAIERDTDVVNTALVFNNKTSRARFVHCVAFDANGEVLGRRSARIPARGVRYLRASDLSNGVDYVGSAVCRSRGRIAASAVFLAPGAITNLDVEVTRSMRIRFPLVASY